MRISELARQAGVPIGTVKFYLREGLVPQGERTSATQARYGAGHLERLLLVRTLVSVGGLSIAATRRVLAALDDPPHRMHELVGSAHQALDGIEADEEVGLEEARAVVARQGWHVRDSTPALTRLARVLTSLQDTGFERVDDLVDRYATAAMQLAEDDVAGIPTHDPVAALRHVVHGTVLLEPLLLTLRRLAQQDASARRFGGALHPGRDGG